jgi:apolipoprotein N-acyltransferase
MAALMAGALSVLAMAPFFLWPVLFLTVPLLVRLIDVAREAAPKRPALSAAAAAWWFAFGYFLAGLFWIGEAFLVEADRFAALMPFAVLLMPSGLALFWAAAAAAASPFWRPDATRVVVLAVTLSAAEWLRGHILTGFPWNILGYALTAPDALMQSAAVFGIYGLTLIAVLVFGWPGVVLADAGRSAPGKSTLRAPLVAAGASGCVLLTLWSAGLWRLTGTVPVAEPPVRLRLVQPSIPQRLKWQQTHQRANFETHLSLTVRNARGEIDGAAGIQAIIWPEAAMPFAPLDAPNALQAIADAVPDGTHLMAGLLRVEHVPPGVPGRRRRILNSLAAFDTTGNPVAIYDKTHLVPFGEYLPYQSTLEAIGLEQLTRIRGGFDVGPTPRPMLRVPGLPGFAPLICYEAIFPSTVIQSPERPAALLNVTNDGWFGNTTGPRQHFHQARVRAVEEGVPIIRSANNGISAVIDAHGRVIARLEMNAVGVVDADLPGRISAPIYARLGDWLFGAMLVLAAGSLAMMSRHGR